MYKKYFYGEYRKEINTLLRDRVSVKEKIRKNNVRAKELVENLSEVEVRLDELLEKAKK